MSENISLDETIVKLKAEAQETLNLMKFLKSHVKIKK